MQNITPDRNIMIYLECYTQCHHSISKHVNWNQAAVESSESAKTLDVLFCAITCKYKAFNVRITKSTVFFFVSYWSLNYCQFGPNIGRTSVGIAVQNFGQDRDCSIFKMCLKWFVWWKKIIETKRKVVCAITAILTQMQDDANLYGVIGETENSHSFYDASCRKTILSQLNWLHCGSKNMVMFYSHTNVQANNTRNIMVTVVLFRNSSQGQSRYVISFIFLFSFHQF